MNPGFPIVGIGASAGGLHALEKFFGAMPAEPDMAFIVVTHLAPDHKSLLPEILARHTPLAVEAAVNGRRVAPNAVYVMPPGETLTIADGRLRLEQIPPDRHERAPIDIFFSSLAQDCGEYAVGVVLSGSGADGVLGLKAIKEKGGLTVAQTISESSGGFAGMPDSAIASGLIDFSAPVEILPAKLVEHARGAEQAEAFVREQNPSAAGQDGERGLAATKARNRIYAALRGRTGHDFSGYKTPTFLRRVHRRMRIRQCLDLAAYADLLDRDLDESALLFRDLLINVTSFFRDTQAFEALASQVVPRLFEGRNASDAVRVWAPGCATGEEVYSIAILLREYMTTLRVPPRVTIFATDINEPSLAVARAGRYPELLLAGMSPARRERFFSSDGHMRVIAKDVRDLCVFSSQNLLRDPPFSRMDLVTCRNLLIYLGAEAQRQVMPILHYALQPRGYLFLGMSESIGRFTDRFAPVDKKHCIYQALGAVAPVRMPLFFNGLQSPSFSSPVSDRRAPVGGAAFRAGVEARVAEKFGPPHVVVNADGDIVYFSSRTGKYLENPPGAPSQQLLTAARRDLRLDLRGMLREALETRRSVSRGDLVIDGEDETVSLTVEPYDQGAEPPLYLVVFNPGRPSASPVVVRSSGDTSLLEDELRDTRERLQGTIEEYETALEQLKSANEELVSLNEEMQSSNEELESSKEELQSLNEELQTVNHELYAKIEDLDRANADLSNLFESSRIATIFLGRDLVIRSFTPDVTRLFNIISTDKGRPLSDLALKLDYPDLQADIRRVLETGVAVERRAHESHLDAPYYLTRLTPYRGAAKDIEGVVATFIDITSLAKSEARQRTLVAELNHRVKNVLSVVIAIAQQTGARPSAAATFIPDFIARLHAMARTHELLSKQNWGEVAIEELVNQALEPYLLNSHVRISASGPSRPLSARTALCLGMVLDELATNAVKYGALSNETGQIAVEWSVQEIGEPTLVFSWRESNGPTVVAPAKKGFGLTLVQREIEYGLGGVAELEFAPKGLTARLHIPLTGPIGEPAREEPK